ncbi:DUF2283 domain-containing protein [Aureimonas leprariae]|uniref:DUF2283 domain-containing protein n=1 Tax=Plantimonas leprariae TaxID=2615207 RepID=A0A7V7PRT0_9HYPH|nr:DUF2283 domain-containing protein [Aureimonas leprariae]
MDITYDPEADAAYFRIGEGKIVETEETGPFICDVDAEGRVIGIEILGASRTLAPGPWRDARIPGTHRADAAE